MGAKAPALGVAANEITPGTPTRDDAFRVTWFPQIPRIQQGDGKREQSSGGSCIHLWQYKGHENRIDVVGGAREHM